MVSPAVLSFPIDFDLDGVYEGDLTDYVTSVGGGFVINRGSDNGGAPQVGEIRLGLDNNDGTFTPDNSASAYHGLLDADIAFAVRVTHLGHVYTLGTFWSKEWLPRYSQLGIFDCELVGRSIMAFLNDAEPVNLTVSTTRDESTAIDAVLDYVGLTASDRLLDDGLQALPLHFALGRIPMDALMEASASGIGGSLFDDALGRVRYHNRQFRTGVSRYRQQVRGLKPALYLRFGEASGATIVDAGRNALNGSYVTPPTLAVAGLLASDIDTAATFASASSQYGTVADNAALDLADAFSVAFWIKPTNSHAGCIVDKGTGAYQVLLDGLTIKLVKTGTGTIAAATTNLVAGTAAFVAVTKSGSAVHIYVNGVDVTGAVSNSTCANTATALNIGRTAAGASYLNATLDDLALWGSALTAADIWSLYLAGAGTSWVWGDSTNVKPERKEPRFSDAEYVTAARVRTTVFRTGQADIPIFTSSRTFKEADAQALAAGEVYVKEFYATSAYVAITTPVSGTDYRAMTAIDGSGTNKTSALTYTVTDLGGGRFRLKMVNTDAGTIYVEYGLRGQPVEFYADRGEASYSKSVPGRKAGKDAQLDLIFAGDAGARSRDFAVQVCRTGRYVPRVLVLEFPWVNDDTVQAMASVEYGDLVRFTDTALATRGAYIDDWFYVAGINHGIQLGGDTGPDSLFTTTIDLIQSEMYRNPDAIAWDSFDRADATGGLGTTDQAKSWQSSTGFDINSNTARANTNTASMAWLAVGGADMVAEISLSNIAADADAEVGVPFRVSDVSNYLLAYLSKATSKVHLVKVVAGVATALATAVDWTPADTGEIRVRAYANQIRVWVDRVRIFDVTDSTLLTATGAGIYAKNASGTVRFEGQYAQAI